MNKLIRQLLSWTYRPLLQRYLRKDRPFHYDGLDLIILKSVFHPAFFGSSKVFARFLKSQALNGKSLLEIGCGSGLLSLVAAKAGAHVTAVDINPAAIACARANARNNHLDVEVIHSDVFQSLKQHAYDILIINPPFFEGKAKEDSSYAWYCGPDYYFFRQFSEGLPFYTHQQTKIWMILSEVCALDPIQEIALQFNYKMKLVDQEKTLFENFLIFEWQALHDQN